MRGVLIYEVLILKSGLVISAEYFYKEPTPNTYY